jgi:hypothetical protein
MVKLSYSRSLVAFESNGFVVALPCPRLFSRWRDFAFAFWISGNARFGGSELTSFCVEAHGEGHVFFHAFAATVKMREL